MSVILIHALIFSTVLYFTFPLVENSGLSEGMNQCNNNDCDFRESKNGKNCGCVENKCMDDDGVECN